jgi:hypothetical protein
MKDRTSKKALRKRLKSMLLLTLIGLSIAAVALYRGRLREQSMTLGFQTPPAVTPPNL